MSSLADVHGALKEIDPSLLLRPKLCGRSLGAPCPKRPHHRSRSGGHAVLGWALGGGADECRTCGDPRRSSRADTPGPPERGLRLPEPGDPVGAFEILVVGVAAVEVAFAGVGGSAVETTPVVDQQYPARLPRMEQCPIGIVEDAPEVGVGIQHIVENVRGGEHR